MKQGNKLLKGALARIPALTVLAALPVLAAFMILFSNLRIQHGSLTAVSTVLAEKYTRVLAEHADQSVQAVDMTLRDIMNAMDANDVLNSIGPQVRYKNIEAIPQLRAISLIDSDGNQAFYSSSDIPPLKPFRDREYFHAHRDGGAAFFISHPYVGNNTQKWTFSLSYRLNGLGGEFSGLLHAAVEPIYFQKFYQQGTPFDGAHVVLTLDDGTIAASWPPADAQGRSYVGRNKGDIPAFAADGDPANVLLTEQRLRHYPLRVAMATPADVLLTGWTKHVQDLAITAAIVGGVLLGAILLVLRYNRREVRAELARRQAEAQVTDQLRQSNELLEQRVAERTSALTGAMEELVAARNRAEAADRAKSRFLASASHDLRQPFQSMVLYHDLLAGRQTDPQSRDIADRLGQAIGAGEELLRALLDISILEAGTVRPNLTEFPLQDLLNKLAGEFGPQAAQKGLRLRVRPCAATVRSDAVLLGRMLRNLLHNAIRYTETGGILVGVRCRGGQLRIEVWDSGSGIPADRLQMIFEEFVQLHNSERDRRQGLGLGLAVVERTGRLLGHPVGVRSRLGRGSVFSVTLSACAPAAVQAPASAIPAMPLAGAVVAVIEDDEAQLEGVSALVRRWGGRPVPAQTVEGVLEKLNGALQPNLIITDYRLRGGNTGTEAIRRIRGIAGNNIRSIIVTGDLDPDRTVSAQDGGNCVLLHKPFRPEQLWSAIMRALVDEPDKVPLRRTPTSEA